MGSPIPQDLFVDIVCITASGQSVAYERNEWDAFEESQRFVDRTLVSQGFHSYIFIAEVSADPNFPLWETYEQKYGLELADRGSVLRAIVPVVRKDGQRYWRATSIGAMANDSIVVAGLSRFKRRPFSRIFFSRTPEQCQEKQIQAFHDIAYRRIPKRAGTPISIMDASVASYLATRGDILMKDHGKEGTNDYVCTFIMPSGAILPLT